MVNSINNLSPAVLVVDDDVDQRELVKETLGLHFPASAGKIVAVGSATECLAQDLGRFDIILLDYNLPDMTGLELLKHVVSRCHAPVLFVTGESVAATAAQAIQLGAQDYIVKVGNYLLTLPVMVEKNLVLHQLKLENLQLHQELTQRMEQIRVTNNQLQESLHMLQTIAGTDPLTALSNRRSFAEALERYFSEARRYDYDLACAMCDLDHYKQLNDTLGHQSGDKVLVATADAIRANLRASDMAARYGGDEFVLLLPHTSMEMAINVVERIRQQLVMATSNCNCTGRGSCKVTMSIGLASLRSDHPASADALVAMADRALYAAKDRGKDRIITYEELAAQTAA
jgi:diguanylate cyclase (GGDEF)-like protein